MHNTGTNSKGYDQVFCIGVLKHYAIYSNCKTKIFCVFSDISHLNVLVRQLCVFD